MTVWPAGTPPAGTVTAIVVPVAPLPVAPRFRTSAIAAAASGGEQTVKRPSSAAAGASRRRRAGAGVVPKRMRFPPEVQPRAAVPNGLQARTMRPSKGGAFRDMLLRAPSKVRAPAGARNSNESWVPRTAATRSAARCAALQPMPVRCAPLHGAPSWLAMHLAG